MHVWEEIAATLATATFVGVHAAMCQTAEAVPQYRTAVLLYAVAAVIETWFEPVYVLTQHSFQMSVRVGVESAALVARCLVTFVLVVLYHQGVLAFGIAQVVNSLVLVAGYYVYVTYHLAQGRRALGVAKARELLPHPTVGAPSCGSQWEVRGRRVRWLTHPARFFCACGAARDYLDGRLLALSGTFTVQSVLKYILSEGDRMVIAMVTSFFDQGVYALVYNYGAFRRLSL